MNDRPSLHVAIVDDDASLCRSLGRYLRASGMEPCTYESAETFLTDKAARFDCLLLDVHLGGMSGLELAKRLRTEGAKVPFIFITAFDDAETRSSALCLGCAGYFRKNDPGAEVVEAIRRVAS